MNTQNTSSTPVDTDRMEKYAAVEVVYVDSKEALLGAYAQGLNQAAEIRSTSPALIADANLSVKQADAHLEPAVIKTMERAFAEMGRDCRGRFDNEDLDLIAGRYVTLEFQAIAGKAATLFEADFSRPTAVVTLCSEDWYLDSIVGSPLRRILAGNLNFISIEQPIETLEGRDDPRQPDPGIFSRLRFTSPSTLIFRLCERLTAKLGLRGPKGTILMIRDNELSKETAFHLLLRGYFPRQIKIVRSTNVREFSDERIQRMKGACSELVVRNLGDLVCTSAAEVLSDILFEDIYVRARRYEASLETWNDELERLSPTRPRAVLTNRINDAELIGLHAQLKKRGVPLVGFQHGVTVEINRHMRDYDPHYESAFCDVELTFNERAAVCSNQNVFRRGEAIPVGVPAEYFRGVKKGRLPDAPPVWFINTGIYVANHGQLEGVTDWDKCRHEVDLIEQVLSQLRHDVLYKPYPGHRFQDPDPIEMAALAAPNLEVYKGRLDLRYIVGSAKVLVSSRSFSTSSWCLLTDLPLVHIDIPEQEPLSPSARAAYEAGTLFFDAGEDGFHEKLRDFLNQPIAEIERLWRDKASAREKLIREFISAERTGAGRRGADAVEAAIDRLSRKDI